jgi:acylphosphatase
MIKAYLIRVIGDVQGVSYRYFAKNEAKKLGLVGWAKNEHDGSVTIFIQGEPEKVQMFVELSKEGSPMATVKDVSIKKVNPEESINNFEVK